MALLWQVGLQVDQHISAVQQRAAVLGTGPLEWAIGAHCQVPAAPDGHLQMAVIVGVSPSGNYLVDGLPSAWESSLEVSVHGWPPLLQLLPLLLGLSMCYVLRLQVGLPLARITALQTVIRVPSLPSHICWGV